MSASTVLELNPGLGSDLENELKLPLDVDPAEIPEELPEGGLRAWLTVIGSWFMLFGTLGYLYGFGVYQDYYTRVYLQEHSPSSISWIGSLQLMMPYFLGLFSGKLFDLGYFYVLEITGSILFTFCLFMLSLAKPEQYYQVILSQGIGMGFGLGLTFIPTVGITSHYFKRRRGLASGIALSGGSCGAVIFPIFLNKLLAERSFGDSVRASGYIVLGCLAVGLCLMRTRPPARKKAGLEVQAIKGWFKEGPYSLLVLSGLFNSLGFFFPVIYLQLYAVQHDVDPNLSFYSLAILNASSAISRVVANVASDMSGPFNLLLPCSLVVSATIWAMLGISNAGTLVLVSVLYGAFSGACLPLSIIAFAFMSKNAGEVGARTGLGVALGSFATLFAAPIQGALLTSNFYWIRPIAFSATMMIATSVCLVGARILIGRERKSQRV